MSGHPFNRYYVPGQSCGILFSGFRLTARTTFAATEAPPENPGAPPPPTGQELLGLLLATCEAKVRSIVAGQHCGAVLAPVWDAALSRPALACWRLAGTVGVSPCKPSHLGLVRERAEKCACLSSEFLCC